MHAVGAMLRRRYIGLAEGPIWPSRSAFCCLIPSQASSRGMVASKRDHSWRTRKPAEVGPHTGNFLSQSRVCMAVALLFTHNHAARLLFWPIGPRWIESKAIVAREHP